MGFRERLRRSPFASVRPDMPDRITLTQATPLLSLSGHQLVTGGLRINLSWRMRPSGATQQTRGVRGLRPSAWFKPIQADVPPTQAMVNIDLDLGCMYELADGSRGVVQPLGELLGNFHDPPYVTLSGDDRFGAASGETMYINLDKIDEIRRMLIFVYIYDRTPAFDRAHGVVTLYPYSGPKIEVRLDEQEPDARSCAVVLLDNRDGNLTLSRELRYVYGFQAELDRLYGFGMQWARGFKPKV